MNDCTPEYCAKCRFKQWCDGTPLKQKSNFESLVRKMVSFQNPNFVVK